MLPTSALSRRAFVLLGALALPTPCLHAALKGSGEVESRSYYFEDAKKDLEYALFVPTSYAKDQPAPLVGPAGAGQDRARVG